MDENKRIEDLAEEVKDELNEAEAEVEEAPEEAKEVLNDVLSQVREKLVNLKDAVAGLDLNKDGVTLGEHLGKFSEFVSHKLDDAGTKLGELKNDPKTEEVWAKTKANVTRISEGVVGKAKEVYANVVESEKLNATVDEAAGKLDEAVKSVKEKGAELYEKADPNVKKTVDAVVGKGKEAESFVAEKYQEFIHNESVRKTVVGAKDTVVDFAEKVISAFKDLLPNEKKEESEEEGKEE